MYSGCVLMLTRLTIRVLDCLFLGCTATFDILNLPLPVWFGYENSILPCIFFIYIVIYMYLCL